MRKVKIIGIFIATVVCIMLATSVTTSAWSDTWNFSYNPEGDITVTPSTISLDLIAGCSVQVNITINLTGNYYASCELTTNIEPDGEGINVSYSKNNFTMSPNSENKIIMYINTSLLLMPGVYNITTGVFAEQIEVPQPPSPPSGGGTDPHITWGNPVVQEEPFIPNEEPEEEPEIPTDPDFPSESESEEQTNDYSIFGFLFLGFILIITLLYFIIRRKANKPGEK